MFVKLDRAEMRVTQRGKQDYKREVRGNDERYVGEQ